MKIPANKSEISDELAMQLARKYQSLWARRGHSPEKHAWAKELKLRVATIVSLTVQDDRIRLRSEYETLKLQLLTAYKHVIQ